MKFCNSILYVLVLLFSTPSQKAQEISEKDSLQIEALIKKVEKEIKDYTDQNPDLEFQYNVFGFQGRKYSKIVKELDKYKLNKTSKPYWILLKEKSLNLAHSGYLVLKEWDSAKYYQNIIEKTDYFSFKTKINTCLRAAYSHYVQYNYTDVLENYNKALNYAKESGNYSLECSTISFLADLFLQTDNFSSAHELFDMVDEELLKETDLVIFKKIKSQILESYISQNNYQKAHRIFNEIEPSLSDKMKKSYDLSRIYTGLDSLELAKAYLNKVDSMTYGSLFLEAKANIIIKTKNYQRALPYVEKLGYEKSIFNRIKLDDYAKMKYEVFEGLERYKEANKELKRYQMLRDSMGIMRENFRIAQVNFRIKKDKELQQLNIKNEKQEASNKKMILFFIGIFILMVFIYFLLDRRNLKTKIALKYANENSLLKNNLIENLSHEFRTPITIINGYLNLIKSNTLKPKSISKYADIAIKNGNQLIQNLNELLMLLKLEGKSTIKQKISSKNMGFFVKETISKFQDIATIRKIHIHFKTNIRMDKDILIDFDYDNLTKILNNLISNAIKFSPENKNIYVSCLLAEQYLNIKVKDEGIGIPKKSINKVFDRFYQLEENLHNGGFGIGLSLVKNIVDLWKGEISLKSEEKVGTEFNIKLPIHLPNMEMYITEKPITIDKIYESTSEINTKEKERNSNLPKALILDDNSAMRVFYEEVLAPYLNCTIVCNGNFGLKKIEEEKFNIIICDLKMPVMNGFEFKEELNKHTAYKEVPFLMVSASPIDFRLEERIKLNIDEFIMKPFSEVELISRIKQLIENEVYLDQVLTLDNDFVEYEGEFSTLMNKFNKLILENIHNSNYQIKELARDCGYSERHFRRIIQAKTGMTPVKLILEIKLLKAYELLKNKVYPTIGEIMYQSGFNSRPYFSKAFFNRFNIKPGDL